jgi:formiminoglutamase
MPKTPSLYYPIQDKDIWSGRPDAKENDYLYQTIKFIDLDNLSSFNLEQTGYVLLGFESDEGVRRNLGNLGAKEGPTAFRKVLGQLPIQKEVILYDAGNVVCIEKDLESAQKELKTRVTTILSLGLMPIVIGGGHETALGHYQGIDTCFNQDNVAILNFDAHFDLRELSGDNLGTSGTPFRQVNDGLKSQGKPFFYYCAGIQPYANTSRLFDYAKENNVNYLLAEKIMANPYDMSFIEDIVSSHSQIYVSVCLDVFNSRLAPGVSAPQALGIDATYVIEALKVLKNSGCVVGLDIVELAPRYDISQQTAKLAAALFFNYCML